MKPLIGESTIAALVLARPPHTIALMPTLAVPAPTRPPIKACELDDGMPSAQVMIFHAIAPIRAPNTTRGSTTSAEIMPVPTVCATCAPKNRKATKLKNAAQATAVCGRSTRVDTLLPRHQGAKPARGKLRVLTLAPSGLLAGNRPT